MVQNIPLTWVRSQFDSAQGHMLELEVGCCVEGKEADKPDRPEMHFWSNLDEGRRRAREKVENCSLKENHGKGESYDGQVDFEKIEGMRGINEGLERRYYVCLNCRFLYAVN